MRVRACKTGNKSPGGTAGVAPPSSGGATIKASRTHIVRINSSRLHQQRCPGKSSCTSRTHTCTHTQQSPSELSHYCVSPSKFQLVVVAGYVSASGGRERRQSVVMYFAAFSAGSKETGVCLWRVSKCVVISPTGRECLVR